MQIEQLIKVITALAPENGDPAVADVASINEAPPWSVGESWMFRTVTHIELGEIVDIRGQFVVLMKASWVADTGRYHTALETGKLAEVEPYPGRTVVNTDSLINAVPWPHELPSKAI